MNLVSRLFCVLLAILGLQSVIRAQCSQTLDDASLHALSVPIGLQDTIELAPSGTVDLYVWDYITATEVTCVRWSVAQFENRETLPVSIEPQTGQVQVAADAPAGWKFDIVADVDGGRRFIVRHGLVIDPSANPIVGAWREDSRYSCKTGKQIQKGAAVNYFVFHSDGTFLAASQVVGDGPVLTCGYEGRYTLDPATGRILLQVTVRAGTSDELKPAGEYRLAANGQLVLKGITFGTLCGGPSPKACEYVFVRSESRPN